MSATFSINVGTITESTRKADIFSVLNDIPDNTQKNITQKRCYVNLG
jgi:ketol-acid reductoisomerase